MDKNILEILSSEDKRASDPYTYNIDKKHNSTENFFEM